VQRRSGLGRGLQALIPPVEETTDHTDERAALLEVEIGAVVPNPRQPRGRFEEEALGSLTDSVRELGVLQPILVRPLGAGRYELVAGERRWRAARRAGLATVPAIVRGVDDRRSLEEALVENLHRQDLNPLEEAAAYQQLLDEHGLTQEEVAQRVGKSRPAVANAVRLFQLPAAVQRLVAEGALHAGHARALLGLPDPEQQEAAARRVVAESLSVRQVEDLVRESSATPPQAARSATPPPAARSATPPPAAPGSAGAERAPLDLPAERPAGLLELEEQLGDLLSTRVRVAAARGRGRITIEFADLGDLERIYHLLVEGSLVPTDPQPVDNDGDNA
jgi:ParB family chromosome partitioning protein